MSIGIANRWWSLVALVLAVGLYWMARAGGARDALRDAELDRLRLADARLVGQYAAQRNALARQAAAATAAVDSAETRFEKSEAARRRLVLVSKTPAESSEQNPLPRTESMGVNRNAESPDTVAVDPRVLELVELQDSTIAQQRRAIARQAMALSTATSSLAIADSLLSVRSSQIRILESKVPSRFWRTVERVTLVSGGLYLGYRVGRAAAR